MKKLFIENIKNKWRVKSVAKVLLKNKSNHYRKNAEFKDSNGKRGLGRYYDIEDKISNQ